MKKSDFSQFTTGHKCSRAQLLILESETISDETTFEEITEEVQRGIEQ